MSQEEGFVDGVVKGNSEVQETSQLIDEKIDSSMSKFKNYFDEKLGNIAKVVELERQLAENKKHLEMLKARGKLLIEGGSIDDGQSELTIYQNAVEKKRGSSSSEDEGLMDFDLVSQNIDVDFAE